MEKEQTMHATEADIVLYLENKLSPERVEQMKRHFAECHRCREQLVMIYRLPGEVDAAKVPDVNPSVFRKAKQLVRSEKHSIFRISLPTARKVALAAMILVAVGISYVFLEQPSSESRFRNRAAIPRALTVTPSDGMTVTQPTVRLSWSAMTNSVGYRVLLFRDNGTSLWEATSSDTISVLPATVELQPGKTYLWKVEAYFPDRSSYESKLHSFVYSP